MSDTARIPTIRGTVTRLSGTQTVRVETKVTKVHPLYRKRYSQVRHYIAHDEAGTAKVGDHVTIVACRPISKTKRWKVSAQID